MKIEIIAIGSEILSGITINTNATFLSKVLKDHSYLAHRHTVLPDQPDEIKKELPVILSRSDILIVTGGLGPTCDDLTRGIFAGYFHKKMVRSEEVARDLQNRFGDKLTSLEDQSMVPEGAKFFCNPVGTAPSLVFTEQGKVIILLPGVPTEMKALFTQKILPFLLENYPPKKTIYKQEMFLALLVESEVDPFLRKLEKEYPDLSIGIYPFYGYLTLSFSSDKKNILEEAVSKLSSEYRNYLYSTTSPKLAEALQEVMIKNKKTFAIAESFTGGSIAASITSVPGSSQYFLGSIVSYANAMKEKQLHVPSSLIQSKGAVSEEVALAMLEGLFKETTADYGIAVTGIAGPDGGTQQKPIGTAWFAIGERGKTPYVGLKQLKGNRETIMTLGVNCSLSMLWQMVSQKLAPFSEKGFYDV